ncbi:MAG TPA: PEGA domain-containing protein [Kofleriaceae bacterium]|jgi:hypothetical protein
MLARLAIFLCAASSVASADSAAVVALGGSPHEQSVASDAVARVARGAGLSVAAAFAPADAPAVVACLRNADPWPCLSRFARGEPLSRVAAISLDGTDATLVITARIAVAGAPAALVGQRFCDHCTDDTLSSLTAELAQELLDRLSVSAGRAVLSVRSTPSGVPFSIDGVAAGATDAAIDVLPGHHTLVFDRDGYAPLTRSFDAVEGKTSSVSVSLSRSPGVARAVSPGSRHSLALPITVTVVGAVALVGGVVAVTQDQSAPAADPSVSQSPHYTRTLAPGLSVAIAGAVVAAAGGVWWFRWSRVTPLVAPTAGGAVVGFSHSF